MEQSELIMDLKVYCRIYNKILDKIKYLISKKSGTGCPKKKLHNFKPI